MFHNICFKFLGSSKPVSIPGSAPFFNRERFPSGSSPHLTNSYNPIGLFNKHDGLEHVSQEQLNKIKFALIIYVDEINYTRQFVCADN